MHLSLLTIHLKMLQCLHNCTFFIFWTLRLPAIFILGKLGLGTSSKLIAAVVELPCKQSILLVATRKFFPTSIPHFFFTCEIYRLETFMPALCSATYFFISSYVDLVYADVISISSSSIVTLM